jgi:hypothetical protein
MGVKNSTVRRYETFEAFSYVEQYDENTGMRDWVIDLSIPPFTVVQEMENICRFDPYVMCRVSFDNKKWIAFYSSCGSLAKCRAFAFGVMAFETTTRKEYSQTLRLVQLARTRECLVCAEYEREHNLPWGNIADDKEAFEEMLGQMGVTMSQGSGSRSSAPGSTTAGPIVFDSPVDAHLYPAKKPDVGIVTKISCAITGKPLPGQDRMGNSASFTVQSHTKAKKSGNKKAFDKDEQLHRDFEALFTLANLGTGRKS